MRFTGAVASEVLIVFALLMAVTVNANAIGRAIANFFAG